MEEVVQHHRKPRLMGGIFLCITVKGVLGECKLATGEGLFIL